MSLHAFSSHAVHRWLVVETLEVSSRNPGGQWLNTGSQWSKSWSQPKDGGLMCDLVR